MSDTTIVTTLVSSGGTLLVSGVTLSQLRLLKDLGPN